LNRKSAMLLSEATDIPSSLVDTFALTLSRGLDLSRLDSRSVVYDLEFPTFSEAYLRAGGAIATDDRIVAQAFTASDTL